MKLIVEITTKDDKVQTHECVDFPNSSGPFLVLYKKQFVRDQVLLDTILGYRTYFKGA